MKYLLAALAVSMTASAASAQSCPSWQSGDLTLTNAWSRATIGPARPAVFYVEIANAGSVDDSLTAISTPLAEMPMLHETVVTDGVATMPHVSDIPVPAGSTVSLAPGGFHGMLMGLTAALAEGESFPMTLIFERSGEVTIDVGIAAYAARGPACQPDDS
ncbi:MULTISPECIES: copper chaperone PCu(A)C [Paracoccaceae]|jgi:copper(I)-binding protein|uniref:copper chaperone PCu(A)C n=1 Tax=Paracoccaceae TaxID=31989 RepID=UPI0015737095|nr:MULTISPECIES: copper chaperone PCu(A)C [Paracoccaceae]MBJ2153455.1 copper chaperone PCu(A)C [Paracoccus sp. IB05]NTT88425.1 copper chaperone PCu(A)C [Tabrizicola sp. SY72]